MSEGDLACTYPSSCLDNVKRRSGRKTGKLVYGDKKGRENLVACLFGCQGCLFVCSSPCLFEDLDRSGASRLTMYEGFFLPVFLRSVAAYMRFSYVLNSFDANVHDVRTCPTVAASNPFVHNHHLLLCQFRDLCGSGSKLGISKVNVDGSLSLFCVVLKHGFADYERRHTKTPVERRPKPSPGTP